MLEKLKPKINEARKKVEEIGYRIEGFSDVEFYNYMTGETPSADIYTLESVLENEYLTLHEVVEISELKKKHIPIDKLTLVNFHSTVCAAHLTAIDFELALAFNRKNYDWIKLRLKQARDWCEEEYLPQELVPRYESLIQRFSSLLKRRESERVARNRPSEQH
jgi:hypothetical protein